MEQSASFRASTSLTPSPVMATVWPARFSAFTRRRFWSGVTRPKTTVSAAAASISSSVTRVRASTQRSAPGIPARLATSDTVMGLSPEITRTETPCRSKKAKVSGASGRILLASRISATGIFSAVNVSSVS